MAKKQKQHRAMQLNKKAVQSNPNETKRHTEAEQE